MAKPKFVVYKAYCEDRDDKPFEVYVYSNRDLMGANLTKKRLPSRIDPINEEQVKTELIKLYHPKNILLAKRFR